MNSAWKAIEQVMTETPVPVRLSRRGAFIVREALSALLKRQLDEGASAWASLQRLVEGPLQTAVKGLSQAEVQVIKGNKSAKDAQVKTGATGEVMMLSPNDWLRIKQEMEANPEYYDMLGGGVTDAQSVAKKIGQSLDLVMGKRSAQQPQAPVQEPHGLALGKASEMTPSVQGPEQFSMGGPGGGTPFSNKSSSAKSSRASRVAAQDMAMMGAKSSKDLGRMSKASKVSVKDAYDRMEEDTTAEGIGKWARGAMAAGALGMAGSAMGADQPGQAHASQGGQPHSFMSQPSVRPERGPKTIDYKKGYRPQPGEYDPNDPMGGLQPDKKPWSNENSECPVEEDY